MSHEVPGAKFMILSWKPSLRLIPVGMIGCALVCAALVEVGGAWAQGDVPWDIQGRLLGEPRAGKESKSSDDVSGIACATGSGFPRLCLIADDEAEGAQVVILQEGGLIAGEFIRLIDATHAGSPLELDAEGVAYADQAFYVIGSHGRPRHGSKDGAEVRAKANAKAVASRHVFRIRLTPDAVDMASGTLKARPNISEASLSRFLEADGRLGFDKALEDGGVTIEGVAVQDGMLFAGLRGPVLDGRDAVVLAVPLDAVFGGKSPKPKRLTFSLGVDTFGKARGVRDIVAFNEHLLILAGPEQDPKDKDYDIKKGDYAIFEYREGSEPKLLLDLNGFGVAVKPEALLPLSRAGNMLRALVLFDGPDEGAPRVVQIPLQ